jgi:hypothetical protein
MFPLLTDEVIYTKFLMEWLPRSGGIPIKSENDMLRNSFSIRHARKEDVDRGEGCSCDDNEEGEPGPTEPSAELSSYGASDGSCYPAPGDRCALTVKWTMGPPGVWVRRVERGALQNGVVPGHEANQSSTVKAAGLLQQLQMQADDPVDHAHNQH